MTQNTTEIRSKVAMLTTAINNMCNVTSIEQVNAELLKSKDLLVEIYKHNAARVTN